MRGASRFLLLVGAVLALSLSEACARVGGGESFGGGGSGGGGGGGGGGDLELIIYLVCLLIRLVILCIECPPLGIAVAVLVAGFLIYCAIRSQREKSTTQQMSALREMSAIRSYRSQANPPPATDEKPPVESREAGEVRRYRELKDANFSRPLAVDFATLFDIRYHTARGDGKWDSL